MESISICRQSWSLTRSRLAACQAAMVWPKHFLSPIVTEVAEQPHKPVETPPHNGHLKINASTEMVN